MSKDILLGADHDLVIENFDLALTDDTQSLKQRIRQQLLFVKGEWFFNEELGTEYYPSIAEKDLGIIKTVIADSIRSVRGVKDLFNFNTVLNNIERTLVVEFEVTDELNNVIGDVITDIGI